MWQIMRFNGLHEPREDPASSNYLLVLSALCVLVLLTSGYYDRRRARRHAQDFADTVIATATARESKRAWRIPSHQHLKERQSSVRVVIDQKRPQMESAIIRAMNEEANKQSCGQYLERFYNAFTSDHGGKINIRPAVERFISVLHQVTRPSPRCRSKLKHSVVRVKAVKWAGNLSRSIGNRGLVRDTAGLALAIRRRTIPDSPTLAATWPFGITIGVSGSLTLRPRGRDTLSLGYRPSREQHGENSGRNTIYRVDSGLTDSALILFVADVLIVGGWLFFARLSADERRRHSPTHRSCNEVNSARPSVDEMSGPTRRAPELLLMGHCHLRISN